MELGVLHGVSAHDVIAAMLEEYKSSGVLVTCDCRFGVSNQTERVNSRLVKAELTFPAR